MEFDNIPTTLRVPGPRVEIDSTRAMGGLVRTLHKSLLVAQRLPAGTVDPEELKLVRSYDEAEGFFGVGSQLAEMIGAYKEVNPYTEVYAIAMTAASGANTD